MLRQIFTDEPVEELRRIHQSRLQRVSTSQDEMSTDQASADEERKGRGAMNIERFDLPDDFLRLPSSVAVLRYQGETRNGVSKQSVYRYESLSVMQQRIMQQINSKSYPNHLGEIAGLSERLFLSRPEAQVFTRAVVRNAQIGLGMTLHYENNVVKVHSVAATIGDSDSFARSETQVGPAMHAGINPDDIVLGFNGNILTSYINRQEISGDDVLINVVEVIRSSPDPVVVHVCRIPVKEKHTQPGINFSGASLLDETVLDSSTDDIDTKPNMARGRPEHPPIWSTPSFGQNGEPQIHGLINLLSSRGLVPSSEEALDLSAAMARFNERAWEMESFSSLRLNHGRSGKINDTLIPLVGVRKALSVRIVNYFTEGNRTAYTIWVYDVESGQEWYAPVRYFEDFADLRHAAAGLIPRFGKLPFPRQTKSIFGSPRSNTPALLESRCWQLEKFLRALCSSLYDHELHASTGEVAIHVQSFLGCETVKFHPVVGYESRDETTSNLDLSMKNALKRSFQFYTYRVFLLKPLAYIVDDFVENMRQKCPSLQDLEGIESQGVATLQQMAVKDLATLEKFLDFLQSTILEGCTDDFRSITMHETFSSLVYSGCFHGKKGEIAWNALVRDAVREQVEVEAYVPLRSVVSRWLVNGWRHEDMEVHFKINELRKRPVSYFSNVPPVDGGPDTWLSVSAILKENVERSTLPCAKLRAIVEAAREISRICTNMNERLRKKAACEDHSDGNRNEMEEHFIKQLGADQFLPILIYCVVMASIERPCALCVLLRSLCDKVSKIGEVGYYFASFEASVVHIRDFDLTEHSEHMRSFVSVNLDAD